ncbi:MAG TPA: hypothetical protein VJN62_12035, partial [Gemmatimonadales bacterium]|nr:hypothetical protein [Gemmatimonadales bacterium]
MPEPSPPQALPFQVSSEASHYVVHGHFAGTFTIQRDDMLVTVTAGSIVSVLADSQIQLRALLAGPGAQGWAILGRSSPVSLGSFALNERRELGGALRFTLSLPSGFDPRRDWLAFEFVRSDRSTTYACADHNLMRPDSLATPRAAALQRS